MDTANCTIEHSQYLAISAKIDELESQGFLCMCKYIVFKDFLREYANNLLSGNIIEHTQITQALSTFKKFLTMIRKDRVNVSIRLNSINSKMLELNLMDRMRLKLKLSLLLDLMDIIISMCDITAKGALVENLFRMT